MAFTGQRFPFQELPSGLKGGIMPQPYSGVVSGLIITAGTVTASACPLNITAGQARLDGQLCTLASNITNLALLGTTNQFATDGTYGPFAIYLNPRRLVVTTTSDQSGTPATGTRTIKVANRTDSRLGDFEEWINIKEYNGSSWVLVDPIEGPPSKGQNNSPYNNVNPVISTATSNNLSFFLAPEKAVYLPQGSPLNLPGQGIVPMRRSGSVLLALVTIVTSGTGTVFTPTVTTYGDFEKVPV